MVIHKIIFPAISRSHCLKGILELRIHIIIMKIGRNDVGLLLDSQMRYHLLFDFPNLEILLNYIVIIYMIGNNIDTHFNNG